MKYEQLSHGDSFYDDGMKYKVSGEPKIIGKKVTVYAVAYKNGDGVEIEVDIGRTVPLTRKASLQ